MNLILDIITLFTNKIIHSSYYINIIYNMNNILAFGSCRFNFNLNEYNLNRPNNLTFIHNHNEVLNIIEALNNGDWDSIVMSKYSTLQKINKDIKKQFFDQIESHNIILLELASAKTFYEYDDNSLKIASNIIEYYNENDNYFDFVKFGNTTQRRDNKILNNYFRKDNIFLSNINLFNNIVIGNYLKNKEFAQINYNKDQQTTIIKIVNMPNNYFQTFSLGFDIDYMEGHSYSVKMCINCDTNNDIFIKYYNGTEFIYTDQKVNNNILIENLNNKVFIGFYKKNFTGEIMTSNLLKEINEFNWNINFNIKSYEIIINDLKEIDNTLPIKYYIYKEDEDDFINSFNKFLNYFGKKKIIVMANLAIKDNNEKKISKYANEYRIKYINFLKKTLVKIPNCYFFENYVTNELLRNGTHYNELGYKVVGEKLEKFLNEIVNKN